MSSVSSSKFFAHSSNDFSSVGNSTLGNLRGKKVKVLSKQANKENVNTLNKPKQPTCSAADIKVIETALSVKQIQSEQSLTQDKKNHQKLVDAAALEIAEVRKTGKQTAVGGLKKAGIKRWKFVVEIQKEEIYKLFIGQYAAQGSFTKVYLTLDNKEAILVPKKKASSEEQMELAYKYISKLHAEYEKMEDFAEETDHVFNFFNYSKQEFIERLPAKPQKIQVGSRLILVAPQATCVADSFRRAPLSQEEVIHRIEILRDVSLGVALMHNAGFVHGDLKPENMLLDKGRAMPHDVGGGNFFYRSDSELESSDKLQRLVRTYIYTHYSDYKKFTRINMEKGDEYYHLGCAGDVFALGVSTIEALTGLQYLNGKAKYPFAEKDYYKENGRKFVDNSNTYQEFWCVEEISAEADFHLKKMLSSALHPNHALRLSALEFAEGLHAISGLLKEVDIED